MKFSVYRPAPTVTPLNIKMKILRSKSESFIGENKMYSFALSLENTIFVDGEYGSDSNSGTSLFTPVKTLTKALTLSSNLFILGEFKISSPLTVNKNIKIIGDFITFGSKLKDVSATATATSAMFTQGNANTTDFYGIKIDVNNPSVTNPTSERHVVSGTGTVTYNYCLLLINDDYKFGFNFNGTTNTTLNYCNVRYPVTSLTNVANSSTKMVYNYCYTSMLKANSNEEFNGVITSVLITDEGKTSDLKVGEIPGVGCLGAEESSHSDPVISNKLGGIKGNISTDISNKSITFYKGLATLNPYKELLNSSSPTFKDSKIVAGLLQGDFNNSKVIASKWDINNQLVGQKEINLQTALLVNRGWQQNPYKETSMTDISWTAGTSLPVAVSVSKAVVTKNRVYLVGNCGTTSAVATVYTAPINDDGTLGTWTTGTPLPIALYNNSVSIIKNRVYTFGGNNTVFLSNVYFATINDDGTLGAWTASPSLPVPLTAPLSFSTASRLYILGGIKVIGTNAPSTSIYYATINDDGSLGPWVLDNITLPKGILSNFVITKNRVYLSNCSYMTSINSDGSISPIIATGRSLPSIFILTQTKNQIISQGGDRDIYLTQINDDGSLGENKQISNIPGILHTGALLVTKSRIYLLGGRPGLGSLTSVATVYTAPFDGWDYDATALSTTGAYNLKLELK